MKLIEDTTTTTVSKYLKYDLGKNLLYSCNYSNDNFVYYQFKSADIKKTHPYISHKHNFRDLTFYYYENAEELIQQIIHNKLEENPKPTPLHPEDLAKVDLSKVICNDTFYERYLYRLNYAFPIPTKYRSSYIGGMDSDNCDIEKASHILKKLEWVSDVEITRVPYYNQNNSGSLHSLDFTFIIPQQKFNHLVMKEKHVSLHDVINPYSKFFTKYDVFSVKDLIRPYKDYS
jgi:hypothetical protein